MFHFPVDIQELAQKLLLAVSKLLLHNIPKITNLLYRTDSILVNGKGQSTSRFRRPWNLDNMALWDQKTEKPELKSPLPKAKPCRQRQNQARSLSWWARPNIKMTNDSAEDKTLVRKYFGSIPLMLYSGSGYFHK
jgi:hypothetical protein